MRFHAVYLLLALVGCASQPVPSESATPVPAERILDASFAASKPGAGQVIVKRDSGAVGSACSTRLFVDAKPAADIRASEKATLQLPAGDYVLSIDTASPICGGRMYELRATVKAGEQSTYRISISGNGELLLSPTAF